MHAVLATSTKVSIYRIFTLTAMRFFPEQEVSKGTLVFVCVCVCAYVSKLPRSKYSTGYNNKVTNLSIV